MEKTLMPADTTAAPDSVESRFTNRNENSTRTELQSKFVAKEVYQVSSNLYSDETVQKPYIAESDDAAETSIAKHGLAKRRHELEQAELAQGHDGRTLWEQLEANKEKKDEEWKAANNPFAPPPGLADDEAEYIDGLEAQKRDFDKRKKAQKEEDTAAFKAAQAQRVVQSGTAGDAGYQLSAEQQLAAAKPKAFKVASLKGRQPKALGLGLGVVRPRGAEPQEGRESGAKRAKPAEPKAAAAPAGDGGDGGALSGLGGYGSSSDSDSD